MVKVMNISSLVADHCKHLCTSKGSDWTTPHRWTAYQWCQYHDVHTTLLHRCYSVQDHIQWLHLSHPHWAIALLSVSVRLKIVTVEPVYKDSYHFTTVTSTGPSCTDLLQSDLDKATICLQWPNFGDYMVIIIDVLQWGRHGNLEMQLEPKHLYCMPANISYTCKPDYTQKQISLTSFIWEFKSCCFL